MRIDTSALQIPLTDLNDLLIEGHCEEEGQQGHEGVWSEILLLLGLDPLNRMHPFLFVPERTCVVSSLTVRFVRLVFWFARPFHGGMLLQS
jgi:hypothetical protein